ncbi:MULTISPECIES: pLS20_p028 family conjugation system transmembrane protein [unclassified Streptococcus]|uniref:pLS20_p028 family conjugation system transmembrane protein n=1 Tax=unclassified Streptococcus TaxID=2608887 RepID=UPI00211B4F3E|nr:MULTISPECIES: hypothetical protein [unclassified Streptococcus]MCQ9212405.1 hypothetical protein [Streptococcus sp. B01]MCQ9214495.1 hypothetical protein [Streptococcus sp. O1]
MAVSNTFSEMINGFIKKNLHGSIPVTDERSAPLVEFYKYWSNYLEPTPAFLTFILQIPSGLAKVLYMLTVSLEHVFNNLFKLFGLFGYLGDSNTIIGKFYSSFQLLGTTVCVLLLVCWGLMTVFGKQIKYKEVLKNIVLVTAVTSVLPMSITTIGTMMAEDAQTIQTLKVGKDAKSYTSLAIQPMKNNVVDLKVLWDNDFDIKQFPMDNYGYIKPVKEDATEVNKITDEVNQRDSADFVTRIDFGATFGVTDTELLDEMELKKSGTKGLFLHRLNTTQDGIFTIDEHRWVKGINNFEPVYLRYKVNWVAMFVQYGVLITLLVLMSIKFVKSISDVLISAIISPIQGYVTAGGSGKKYKELLMTIGGALAGIIFEVVILRVVMEVFRDLPTLSVSTISTLSGGFFDGLNMWEQFLASILVYLGVFFSAMNGVSMIERWLGVSTGHNDTFQQMMGAMMLMSTMNSGMQTAGSMIGAVGDAGKFAMNTAQKIPNVARGARSAGSRLANGIARTGGGLRGIKDSAKEQGLAKAIKGGLSNGYNLGEEKVKAAVGGVKDYARQKLNDLDDKATSGYEAVRNALSDPHTSDTSDVQDSSISQTPDSTGVEGEVGGLSEPDSSATGSTAPEKEGGLHQDSDPDLGQIDATKSRQNAPSFSQPKKESSSPKGGLGKPKRSSGQLGKSLHNMQRMNQAMQQASQRMSSGQSHIKGAESEEEE